MKLASHNDVCFTAKAGKERILIPHDGWSDCDQHCKGTTGGMCSHLTERYCARCRTPLKPEPKNKQEDPRV